MATKDPVLVPEHGDIAVDLIKLANDPLDWLRYSFEWGSGELAAFEGPDDWAEEFLEVLGDTVTANAFDGITPCSPVRQAVGSGHGIGKGQGYSTIVETPAGPRRWGELQPGDWLIGADGRPTTITHRHELGVRPLYRVTFHDRSSTLVTDDHLWNVRGRQHRRRGLPGWDTMSTRDLIDAGVKRPNGASQARQWEIPQQGITEFSYCLGPRPEWPEAYTLGAWLGDGTKKCGKICNPDPEVWENIGKHYELGAPDKATGIIRTVIGLQPRLRRINMLGAKCDELRVPEQYRYDNSSSRLSMLQGLLDTDGTVDANGQASFTSVSHGLVEDVVWLARSLGLMARVRPAVQKPFYKDTDGNRVYCKPAWTCGITWDGTTQLFRIARKQNALQKSEHRYQVRWIDSIEYARDEDSMCVTVDAPDGLYLTNGFIVTHNSALVAWIILWIMSTRPNCKGTVTASTSTQLETRTFPELVKWYNRFIGKDLYRLTTGRGSMRISHVLAPNEWYCSFQTCAKENSDAFQGQHAVTSTSFFINDESSGIPDEIWAPQRGGLTDGEPMHFAFGNRTKNTGEFHEIWGDQAERWVKWTVDSRDVKITNKRFLQELIDDYGLESDIVRVRVLGLPPTAASNQFISSLRISEAVGRSVEVGLDEPLILGVDVARHGGDHSVIYARKGRDGRTHGVLFKEAYTDNLTHFSEQIAGFIQELGADRAFVDGGGVGGGVVDHLHASGFRDVVREVNFGSKSPDRKYHNRRAYMWGMLRDWLAGGSIPNDSRIIAELTAQEYTVNVKTRSTQLVAKEHMKAMGLESPDFADALALTFAEVVAAKVENAGVIGWGHERVYDQTPERKKFNPLIVR